jgi:intracellular multiplication protein IcmP
MQPSPRTRAWPSGDDYTFLSLLVIGGGLAVFGYVGWSDHHAEISRAFAQLAHWHILVIRRFTDAYDGLDAQLLGADYGRVSPRGIRDAATTIGLYFRLPVAALLSVLAFVCMVRAAPARFARRLDLDALIGEQVRFFHSIAAFADRRLRLAPLRAHDPRPADPALHPLEWLDRYVRRADGTLDEARVRHSLEYQLGPAWCGVAAARPHARLLFVAFALHRAQRREDAAALLGDMAEALRGAATESGTGPEAPLTLPDALIARADTLLSESACTEAADIAARHGFTAPALMSLLMDARRRGEVLPPAAFNGLKLVDRPLWYALHSLGFPSEGHGRTHHPNPCIEAIGARDHWAMETLLGRPVATPAVARALASVLAVAARGRPG